MAEDTDKESRPDESGMIAVVNAHGMHGVLPISKLEEYKKYGWRVAGEEENRRVYNRDKYSGRPITAAALSALGTASFGISDVIGTGLGYGDELEGFREFNPTASTVGNIAGVLTPGGVASLAEHAGERVAAGVAGRLGESGAARFASRAAGDFTTNAILGAGQGVTNASLSDHPLGVEAAISEMGTSALLSGFYGAGIGAGMRGLAALSRAAGREVEAVRGAIGRESGELSSPYARTGFDTAPFARAEESTAPRVSDDTEFSVPSAENARAASAGRRADKARIAGVETEDLGPVGRDTEVTGAPSGARRAIGGDTEPLPTNDTDRVYSPDRLGRDTLLSTESMDRLGVSGRDQNLTASATARNPVPAVDSKAASELARADGEILGTQRTRAAEGPAAREYWRIRREMQAYEEKYLYNMDLVAPKATPAEEVAYSAMERRLAGAKKAYDAELASAPRIPEAAVVRQEAAQARAASEAYTPPRRLDEELVQVRKEPPRLADRPARVRGRDQNLTREETGPEPTWASAARKWEAEQRAARNAPPKKPLPGRDQNLTAPATQAEPAWAAGVGKGPYSSDRPSPVAGRSHNLTMAATGPEAVFEAAARKWKAEQAAQATVEKAAKKPGGLMAHALKAAAEIAIYEGIHHFLPDGFGESYLAFRVAHGAAGYLGRALGGAGAKYAQKIQMAAQAAAKILPKTGARVIPAAQLASRISFADLPKAPKQDPVLQRMDEIRYAANHPGETNANILRNLSGISALDPSTADKMATQAQRALAFLASKLPRNPGIGALDNGFTRYEPSDAEKNKMARYIAAIEDPMGRATQELAGGQLTTETVEVLKQFAPEGYRELQKQIVDHISDLRGSLSYERRVQLSALMSVPIDSTMQPDRVAMFQTNHYFSQQPKPKGPNAPQVTKPQPTAGQSASVPRNSQ